MGSVDELNSLLGVLIALIARAAFVIRAQDECI